MQRLRQRTTTSYGRRVASLRYLPSGLMLQLEAPYDREFTDTLKKSIPAKKRMWDANDKCWYIVKDQLDKLCHILDSTYDETLLLDFPAQEVADSAWATLFLLPNTPLDVVRAVYKTLANKHHPDKGGDVGTMQVINAAYQAILGEFRDGGVE